MNMSKFKLKWLCISGAYFLSAMLLLAFTITVQATSSFAWFIVGFACGLATLFLETVAFDDT